MGIHGLWPLIESTSTSITLDALEGKRLAIDISFWLYQAAQGYNNAGVDAKFPHLALLIRRIAKLLFYKIRPIFVFDGSEVPIFKQQLLRDRSLKKHLDELVLNKNQKKMLEQIAKTSQSPNKNSLIESNFSSAAIQTTFSPQKKFGRHSNDQDLFVLPNVSTSKLNLDEIKEEEKYDYLNGYGDLMTSDARVAFLKDAKEKCRGSRLTGHEIPEDSKEFSNFQLKRLINRNKINIQLDMIRKEKLQQCVKISSDNMKIVVIDHQLNSHVLLRDDDVQIIDPEKEQREKIIRDSLSWPEFLRQHNATKTNLNVIKNGISIQKSVKKDNVEEDDDDLQEAILASIAEQNVLTNNCFKKLPESRYNFDLHKDNWTSSGSDDDNDDDDDDDDDDEFEDIKLDTRDYNNQISSRAVSSLLQTEKSTGIATSSLTSSPNFSDTMENSIVKLNEDELYSNNEEDDSSEYFPKTNNNLSRSNLVQQVEESSVYSDCQTLLSFLGLPYICAPGEAEAQCVELERLGLADGIVSDDSDVWLFGAKLVYKNMFSQSKHVQEYRRKKIFDELGLARSEFIQIGMLSGGDYSRGFEKIGIVTGLELISDFLSKDDTKLTDFDAITNTLNPLKKIGEWLRLKNRGLDENKQIDKKFVESKIRLRLRKIIEENNEKDFIEKFPNTEVFDAYAKPNVNSSNQRFQWKRINFTKFEEFLWNKMGWNAEKLKFVTHGAFNKWDEFLDQASQQYQTRITSFITKNSVVETDSSLLQPNSRVQTALQRLKKIKFLKTTTEHSDDDAEMDAVILADLHALSSSTSAVNFVNNSSSLSKEVKKVPVKQAKRLKEAEKSIVRKNLRIKRKK